MRHEHAIRPFCASRQHAGQQAGRGARQYRPRRACPVECVKDLLFQAEILEDSFHYEVGFRGDPHEVCAWVNPRKRRGDLFFGKLPQSLLHCKAAPNIRHRLVQPHLTATVQLDVIPMSSEVLSNAMTHQTCANNGDTSDFDSLHISPLGFESTARLPPRVPELRFSRGGR